jgi:hypothetical protein
MGFLIMGVIGYIVKLSEYFLPLLCAYQKYRKTNGMLFSFLVHIPVNNILVGGA